MSNTVSLSKNVRRRSKLLSYRYIGVTFDVSFSPCLFPFYTTVIRYFGCQRTLVDHQVSATQFSGVSRFSFVPEVSG